FLAELHVGPLKPDDQRPVQPDFPGRGDHAFGDDVASHDAAEDVDKDPLDVRVGQNDLERFGHLFLGRAAANVEEVGRFAAVMLDDVHRRHGQSGTVDHAADVAVQGDVGQAEFRSLDFLFVFFVEVAQFQNLRMPEKGVVVEVEFRVQRYDVAGTGDHQRVDLRQRTVFFHEHPV